MVYIRLEQLEEYAQMNNIPIMHKDGIEYVTKFIKENKIKKILEIGTAIGYSAIKMALVDKDINIITIERDPKRYEEALENIKIFELQNQITVYLEDALNIHLINQTFDFIFIDAAKSQYIKFFEKFAPYLNKNGVIVSDNLNFHGLVNQDEKELSKNVKGLVKKLKQYRQYLEKNPSYQTEFLDIGDGISISKKI